MTIKAAWFASSSAQKRTEAVMGAGQQLQERTPAVAASNFTPNISQYKSQLDEILVALPTSRKADKGYYYIVC